ncbi:MAG: cobalamin B12-binding domain-containing protein [Rhodocyclales bacterium]|nr:cobalamin B12-binding domain-containing protein [Rhodocyclales bacterium]
MKRPRVLIVNCYSDNHRGARGNYFFAPQPMTGAVLAGLMQREKVDVRIHCEFSQGPFEDLAALGWADLLVLTGLNPAFDRMKQLTAYARTVNPRIAVAMGGSLARALPRLSSRYFDYVCTGDVEDVGAVLHDVFGPGYAAERPLPRYDLANWLRLVGFAESSRNCNFRCGFCSMTAEDRQYAAYDVEDVRRQVEAMGYRTCVMFLDQNFYAGTRSFFRARLALLRQLCEERKIGGWSALVTTDFYANPENLRLAKEAGCIGFFSGVESFSREQIAAYNKKQNLILPQEDVICRSLDAGLVFHYGMVFDPTARRITGLMEEIDFIVGNPKITLPNFLCFAIPLLGTPLFAQRLGEGSLLPDLKLRDMDGRSVICHTLDPLDDVVAFARKMDRGIMPRRKLAAHAWKFHARYRGSLRGWSMSSALANTWSMAFPGLGTNGRDRKVSGSASGRSYLATTERTGSLYRPIINIPERWRQHFAPLFITDGAGELHEAVCADLGVSGRPAAESTLPDIRTPPTTTRA